MKEDRRYKVYIHIIPRYVTKYKHDKYYIGVTCRKKIEWRWGKNGEGYKTQVFYKAIQKYGWDNIQHKILYDNLTKKEAEKLEIKLIKQYDSTIGRKGYNLSKGGEGLNGIPVKKSKLVYCIDLHRAFKNSTIASQITGDNQSTINTKCRDYDLHRENRVGYRWCYYDRIYQHFEEKVSYQSKIVVYLQTGKIYGSCYHANKVLGKNFNRRSTLNLDKYYKKLNNNTLYKKDRLMFLEDYLKIFDSTN